MLKTLPILAALLLTACPTSEDISGEQRERADYGAEPAEPEEEAEQVEEDVEEEIEPEEEPEDVAGEFLAEFDEPHTWTDSGMEVHVHRLSIRSRERVAEDLSEGEMDFAVDDERVQAFLILDVEAFNGTDKVVSFYPDQGTVVVGDEQREAHAFASGDVGGEWQPGTRKRDQVIFPMHKDHTSLVEEASLRYIVDGAFDLDADDMDNYDVSSDVDLTVEW